MDRNAEKVNSSLDEFTDEYAEYLRLLDETDGSEDFVPEEAEARVMDLRDKLVEDMMEYHRSAGMGEAEARKRSWELVNQTMTDINIALLRKGKSGNIELLPENTIKVKRMNESEEAKEWLPELGEGEFCYMERKFSEDKSFVFSAPEHIESMDDVAYIFKQLEKYSVEHSFLALVKDGKVTVVHLGMGNATSAIVNMAAARAALDKFDPDMVYFVHNHPSGVLTASIPDVDSLQTLRDMTKGKVECEALIIDTLSGKYAQFGLDGKSRILDLPKGFDNEVEVKVQAHDKMEYSPDFTPDNKKQTNSAGDIVKYVSSLRVGVGDKVGVLVMNQQNHILANLYLPMEEDMRVLGDDIAGKVVRFGGNRVIVYTNNGQMLEVGKALEDAIKRRSGKSVLLLDVLRLKKDGDYQALSESVFEDEGEYGEKGGSNDRYRDSDEIDKEYPAWLDGTINDSGKHSTQVEGTRKTYNKVADWIENNIGKNVSILDASSGMGYGTGDLRERGFDIEDVEPYQSVDRKKNNPATYDSYDKIGKQYDYIISNAVLNVIPDDWRANVLHDMARCLKPGGRMFINTRKAGEEKYIKDKIELDSPQEILVKRNGKIASYQRFFTPRELQRWVQEELGAGYSVEIANERNSGTKGLAAVVVTKNNGSPANSEASGLGQPIRYNEDAPVANFDAKLRKLSERTKRLDAIISFIREGNKLGSHEFLHELNNAMLLSNRRSTNSSNYVNLGSGVTLRISNHYANVDSFRRNNNLHDNYGIVIKLSPSRFKDDPKVDYLEYVYFPDKLTKERQLDILNGLKSFMSSGRYESLPEPDKVNASGIYKEKHANPTSMDQVDMRSEAERLSAELNTPVRIITDAEGAASLPTVRQRRAKGFWSEKDGVVVILSNHKDVADVAGTVLHEIVGHDGLRIKRGKKWTDKEWAFVLHEAWKRKRNGGNPTIKDMADTEAMRNRTGFNQVLYNEVDGRRLPSSIAEIKDRVMNLFERSANGDFTGKPASIGRLSTKGKEFLENISGLQFKEHVDFVLNPSDLRHIRNDHYGQNEKDPGNNIPLTDVDIRNIVDVINNPDGIIYGLEKETGRKLFFFLKRSDDGLYNLAEVCSTKRGNLTAKSFFKSKKKGISQRVMEITKSLLPTSVTYSGESLSSDAKIPNLFELEQEIGKDSSELIRFRDDEGLDEAITRMKVEEAAKNAGNLEKRDEAIRAIKLYREYCRGYPASNRSGKSQICSEWRAKDFALRQLWC